MSHLFCHFCLLLSLAAITTNYPQDVGQITNWRVSFKQRYIDSGGIYPGKSDDTSCYNRKCNFLICAAKKISLIPRQALRKLLQPWCPNLFSGFSITQHIYVFEDHKNYKLTEKKPFKLICYNAIIPQI